MNATGCRIGPASLAVASAGLASLIVLSLALWCEAREPSYEFIHRLVAKRTYVLSPSGNHVLIYGRLPDGQSPWPARYHVVVHEIDETGLGNYRDLSPLRLQRMDWSRRTDRDELFGVRKGRLYRIQLDGSRRSMADNRPEDMTPANMKDIKILLRDPGGNGKLVISGVERGRAIRGFYRCELELLPENHCEWMADESDEVKGHVFDYAGRIVARLRWDPANSDPYHLEIPDESTASGWRSTFSFDPSETDFKSVTLADENGDLLALSNRKRDVVALVRFNIRSGRETVVVSQHDHDIGQVFKNKYTQEPLATSSFPDLQRIEFLNPSFESRLQELLETAGQPVRLEFQSTDSSLRRFIVRVRSARIGYATVLVYGDGKLLYLDRSEIGSPPGDRTPYVSPEPVVMDGIEGPPLKGLLTRPKQGEAPFPFVIMVHGGPRSQYRWNMHPLVQRLVSMGMAVLQLNYRGSSGYDREYAGFMLRNRKPFESVGQDVEAAHEWLVSNGVGKPGRAGLWGESFGTTVAVQAAAKAPDRYPAVGLFGGMFDFSMFVNSPKENKSPRIWTWRHYMGARDAAELLAKGAKINPCSLAAGLRSSTMIMAGMQDRVTHPDQSLALHDELRARGIPSRISLRRHGHETRLRHLAINIFANAADFFHEELVRNSVGNPKETASLERPLEDPVEECLAPRRSIRAFLRQKMGFKK